MLLILLALIAIVDGLACLIVVDGRYKKVFMV